MMRRTNLVNNSKENIFAREKAIKYIGISKKTEYEVRKKLKGLNIAPEVIDEEIIYLKELAFIDDEDYVLSYIRQADKMMQYSIYEIKNKLLQKGIKASIIEDKIEILLDNDYENRTVEKLLKGKLKSYEDIKQKAYLFRRGFKYSGRD